MERVFHWYGLIIGLAVVAAWSVSAWASSRLKGRYQNLEAQLDNLVWWVLVFGLVGARLYHVIDYWEYYSSRWLEAVMIWNGGLGIYGAIGGGVLAVFCYSYWYGRDYGTQSTLLLDLVVLGLPLGQAIGRFGNLVNFEVYGYPTDAWWAIYIPPTHRMPQYISQSYYHPLFLYESIWCLIGFLLGLYFFDIKKIKFGKGNFFLSYLVWYGIGRSVLEYMRPNPWVIWNIPVASLVGMGILMVAGIMILYRIKRHEW